MRRKSLATFTVCLISAMLLTGCGKSKSADTNLKDQLENAEEDTAAAEDEDGQDEENPGNKTEITDEETDEETDETGKSDSDLDFAGAFREGLAKDIIYFQGGDDKAEKSDKDDPLKGLVSDDILTMFRESNLVKSSDSIEKEALALGKWVQKSINKIPADTREKGEKIGLHYEFWFGTDIGNNFDSNFPMIYGAYYCLKDYYTSDGKRSKEFYDKVMEENEFLGNGNPENIENMYTDMQGFITDCNNIIRNK